MNTHIIEQSVPVPVSAVAYAQEFQKEEGRAKEEKVLKIRHGDPEAKSPAGGGHGEGEAPSRR